MQIVFKRFLNIYTKKENGKLKKISIYTITLVKKLYIYLIVSIVQIY